jgi:hypothetical protein
MNQTPFSIITGQHLRVPDEVIGQLTTFYGGDIRQMVDTVMAVLPKGVFEKVEIFDVEAPFHAPKGATGGLVSGYLEMRFLTDADQLNVSSCFGLGIYFGVRDSNGMPVKRGFDPKEWFKHRLSPQEAPIVLTDRPEAEFFQTALIAALELQFVKFNGVEL